MLSRLGTLVSSTVVTSLMVVGGAAACLASGSREERLAPGVMEVIFGGQTVNQLCCGIDGNCQSTFNSCNFYNGDEKGCINGTKPYFNVHYAWFCGAQDNGCPTCDCADWLTDSNGTQYNCIRWWACIYVQNTCVQSVNTGSTLGHYKCEDNCR